MDTTGGLKSTASVVNFSVDKALLDSMNIADGTSYELLPADCYQLTKSSVDIPANERLLKGEPLTTRLRYKSSPDMII